ncbi:hypothetical protein HMEPL2_39310 [Vreelandella aquamarina]|uniref:Uncharacterized protein n=1 Tax=Vreelandella aquamarina TaxID=77097 RepID=A0A6F8XIE2_9GAMM|nr:hypothetical protein [Halomonas meridiana]BCB73580.1 hypothetical protein HMEPL2_39310 [Halomonas meridiana]
MINQFEMLLGHAIVIETASGSVLTSNNFDLSQMQGVVDKPEGFIHIAQGANTLLGLDVRSLLLESWPQSPFLKPRGRSLNDR